MLHRYTVLNLKQCIILSTKNFNNLFYNTTVLYSLLIVVSTLRQRVSRHPSPPPWPHLKFTGSMAERYDWLIGKWFQHFLSSATNQGWSNKNTTIQYHHRYRTKKINCVRLLPVTAWGALQRHSLIYENAVGKIETTVAPSRPPFPTNNMMALLMFYGGTRST
jgi:hypothetical protein